MLVEVEPGPARGPMTGIMVDELPKQQSREPASMPAATMARPVRTAGSAYASLWRLDPAVTFLNHGSYGAVPESVRAEHAEIRARMEREPVRFFKVDLERLMDEAREAIGRFIDCDPMCLAPVANATIALCTVFANIDFRPGDEVVVTDHEYSSGVNELQRIAAKTGIRIVTARIPFPAPSSDWITRAVEDCLTSRTRLVMVSQITSCTSLILPVKDIVERCRARGIDTLVDGTHAPGQIPVSVRDIDPTYFVGSGHKWMCAPKGTGFMYVHPSRQASFRTLALSSRAAKVRHDRALFLRDFDYMGTDDYSNILAMVPAMRFIATLMSDQTPGTSADMPSASSASAPAAGGESAALDRLYAANHELVLRGRDIVAAAIAPFLGPRAPLLNPPARDDRVARGTGSMTTLVLPDEPAGTPVRPTLYDDPLQDALVERHAIVVPIWRFSATNQRVLRISAQVYNSIEQYHALASALTHELAREIDLAGGIGPRA